MYICKCSTLNKLIINNKGISVAQSQYPDNMELPSGLNLTTLDSYFTI